MREVIMENYVRVCVYGNYTLSYARQARGGHVRA